MGLQFDSAPIDAPGCKAMRSQPRGRPSVSRVIHGHNQHGLSGGKHQLSLGAVIVAAVIISGIAPELDPPPAQAKPAPDIEYMYDVTVRRAYNFPDNDPLGYGYKICDKVRGGEGYPQVMGDIKADVTPNDEFAANYLVSYAVDLLCPNLIPQLRDSAANYRPPAG